LDLELLLVGIILTVLFDAWYLLIVTALSAFMSGLPLL